MKANEVKHIKIYCDGGSKNNGSPNSNAYYSLLVLVNGKEVRRITEQLPPGRTNNQAEFEAMIAAFAYVTEHCQYLPNRFLFTIITDSQLVCEYVNGNRKIKADNLVPLAKTLDTFTAIEWINVKVEQTSGDNMKVVLGH